MDTRFKFALWFMCSFIVGLPVIVALELWWITWILGMIAAL